MTNNLTSLTGFGEGDPKPEGGKGKALANKVSKVTRDKRAAPQSYVDAQKKWKERGFKSALDEHLKTAKSKALSKRTETRKGYDKYVSVAKKEGRPHFDTKGDYHTGK